MQKYITTPIFYVNAPPHLGHAYTAIVADTVARFNRLCGDAVFLQTGTDEHGDKIVQAAADAGIPVRDYVDRVSGLFRETWKPLAVVHDNFIRTTDPNHIRVVQSILQKVHDQGDLYFSEYSGRYCKGCERFLTDKELVDGLCPDHKKAPEEIREQNWFFRMGKYQEWLVEHINKNPEFITPERYRNEVLSFLQAPLEDLCISRPTSRLTWGIPLPFDNRFVTYVWFDALINYLTGIGYPDGPDFNRWWAASEHIIAKDILKPHAIYWPTMLRAMGLPAFRRLHVHGYWNINDTKMSKSLGNVVRPEQMASDYGVDAVRYFLLREMVFGIDASYSEDAVLGRQNADLANDLGNLFSRSLAMAQKFAGGKVPTPGEPAALDQELAQAVASMLEDWHRHMTGFAFSKALQAVWEVVGRANRYIVANEPWSLVKDPAKRGQLDTMLYYLIETLRLVALTLIPIMPETASKMAAALGLTEPMTLQQDGVWGKLAPGTVVNAGTALFPRLDRKTLEEKRSAAVVAASSKSEETEGQQITFEDFQKVDLRVAEVIAAERVPKSDRLLKLTVRCPEERTIVAGIAQYYTPEDMVGRQVIVVANLKPAKLMGITSQGMVLAAKDGAKLVVTAPSAPIAPGSRVA